MNLGNMLVNGAALRNLHSMLVLLVLVVCSIICLALIVERILYFRRIRANPEEALLKIRSSLLAGRAADSLAILGDVQGNPILSVIQAGIKNSHMPKPQLEEMLRICQMKQKAHMEKYLVVLGTLGNTAPFIGLLGTVMGIIQAFKDLAGAQAAGNGASVVAVGIAEALIATAAGLMVAIPAVVFYNVFLKKVKRLTSDMEIAGMEIVTLITLGAQEAGSGGSHAS